MDEATPAGPTRSSTEVRRAGPHRAGRGATATSCVAHSLLEQRPDREASSSPGSGASVPAPPIEALTGDGADAWLAQRIEARSDGRARRSPVGRGGPQRVATLTRSSARPAGGCGPGRRPPSSGRRGSGRGQRPRRHPPRGPEPPVQIDRGDEAFAKDVRSALDSGVIAVGREGPEPELFVSVSDDLVARGVSADALVKAGAVEIAGRGGGRPQMGQAKGTAGDGLGRALEAIRGALEASG